MSRPPREVPHELALASASAIAYSAGVVLSAHRIPHAGRLAVEVGNNCAQNVVMILEAFMEDGTILPSQHATRDITPTQGVPEEAP